MVEECETIEILRFERERGSKVLKSQIRKKKKKFMNSRSKSRWMKSSPKTKTVTKVGILIHESSGNFRIEITGCLVSKSSQRTTLYVVVAKLVSKD